VRLGVSEMVAVPTIPAIFHGVVDADRGPAIRTACRAEADQGDAWDDSHH
jgi:hypothetical protein